MIEEEEIESEESETEDSELENSGIEMPVIERSQTNEPVQEDIDAEEQADEEPEVEELESEDEWIEHTPEGRKCRDVSGIVPDSCEAFDCTLVKEQYEYTSIRVEEHNMRRRFH